MNYINVLSKAARKPDKSTACNKYYEKNKKLNQKLPSRRRWSNSPRRQSGEYQESVVERICGKGMYQ